MLYVLYKYNKTSTKKLHIRANVSFCFAQLKIYYHIVADFPLYDTSNYSIFNHCILFAIPFI